MRALIFAAALAALPGLALADSGANAVDASAQTSIAAGAIGESGARTAMGVVAVPLGVAAVATGSAAVGAGVSGAGSAANGLSAAAGGLSAGVEASSAFANGPLTVTDEIVGAPAPQPAPIVPATPPTEEAPR